MVRTNAQKGWKARYTLTSGTSRLLPVASHLFARCATKTLSVDQWQRRGSAKSRDVVTALGWLDSS